MTKTPLHGTKTHPLSAHALEVLRSLKGRPRPRQEVNPGVANRLDREDLVVSVSLPSPYSSHKGQAIEHLAITAKGLERLKQAGE